MAAATRIVTINGWHTTLKSTMIGQLLNARVLPLDDFSFTIVTPSTSITSVNVNDVTQITNLGKHGFEFVLSSGKIIRGRLTSEFEECLAIEGMGDSGSERIMLTDVKTAEFLDSDPNGSQESDESEDSEDSNDSEE